MRPFPALLHAIRATIRDYIGSDGAKLCDVRPDGQPPPAAGQWFYAVHPGGITGDTNQTDHLDQSYRASVTVTRKSGGSPNDRIGQAIMLDDGELFDRVENIINLLHGREGIVTSANAQIPSTAAEGFYEPLRFKGAEQLTIRDATWFFADPSDGQMATVGMSVTVNFGDARYCKDKR